MKTKLSILENVIKSNQRERENVKFSVGEKKCQIWKKLFLKFRENMREKI
jgi:hypothetical protein